MEQQKSKCEHKKMIIIDEIIQCVSCGKTKYDIDREQPKESSWEEELKALLNNPRTGLKESSDTNKTRYAILDYVQQLQDKQKEKIKEGLRSMPIETVGNSAATLEQAIKYLDSL